MVWLDIPVNSLSDQGHLYYIYRGVCWHDPDLVDRGRGAVSPDPTYFALETTLNWTLRVPSPDVVARGPQPIQQSTGGHRDSTDSLSWAQRRASEMVEEMQSSAPAPAAPVHGFTALHARMY